MKVLTPRIHGVVDYLTVVLFVMAPTFFGLSGFAATLAYLLAAVHLLLTLATAFPFGAVKWIPLPVHGWIELLVALVLIVAPWFLAPAGGARVFYVGIGVVILVVWALTDYRAVVKRLMV
jgi:hypothetical protein